MWLDKLLPDLPDLMTVGEVRLEIPKMLELPAIQTSIFLPDGKLAPDKMTLGKSAVVIQPRTRNVETRRVVSVCDPVMSEMGQNAKNSH